MDPTAIEGITFDSKSGHKIISYPKVHYNNGSSKNSETNNLFKPTVRLFKNARSYMVNNGIIDGSIAPSFFVECLLYNVPNNLFVSNNSDTFINILKWLSDSFNNNSYMNFMCQDQMLNLFGNSDEQWDFEKAVLFALKLVELWTEW